MISTETKTTDESDLDVNEREDKGMMKKRMMAAMLAGAMVLSMTACGNSGDTGSAASTGGDAGAEAPAADTEEAAEAPAAGGPVELLSLIHI